MLDRGSRYEVLTVAEAPKPAAVEDEEESRSKKTNKISVLLLHKVTETGSPFIVVAGYYLNEVGSFDSSVLAEIETVPESDYSWLKDLIRKTKHRQEGESMSPLEEVEHRAIPITFW